MNRAAERITPRCDSPSIEPFNWYVVSVVVGLVALFKTLRPPLRWAATLAQVDYRFGLVKRGFFGSTFTPLFHLQRFKAFTGFSFAVLIVLLVLLAGYTVRSGLVRRRFGGIALVLFCSSYGISYLGQITGYFDEILAVLTLSLLLIRNPSWRFWLGLPATVVGIAIHEDFLLLFLPVLLFSFLWQTEATQTRRSGRLRALTLGLVSLAATAFLALRPGLTVQKAQLMGEQITRTVDYAPATIAFSVLTRSLVDNLQLMRKVMLEPFWIHDQMLSLFVVLPTVFLLLWLTAGLIRSTTGQARLVLMAIAAALSPLLLHALGWDAGRWNALTILTSFLVLTTTSFYAPAREPAPFPSQTVWSSLLLVCLLNMSSGGLLLGEAPVRNFPFIFMHRSLRVLLPSHWSPYEPTVDQP